MAYPQAWFQRNPKGQITGSYSQVPIPKDGTPTWLPLIPEGRFYLELAEGEAWVDIRRADLEQMVDHFRAGFPGPAGIPVDQRADHTRNPEGAYAFYTDLKLDDDGLWGLFTPTELGKPVLASGALPYVSPVFCVGDAPDEIWGKSNILIDAALCTQPQFGGQPQMVLASARPRTEETLEAASAADSSHEGVSDMTPEEIQTMIDEAIAAAKATWDEEAKSALEALEAEKAALQATIDDLTAKATDAEALQAAFDALAAKQAEMEAEAKLAAAINEFEGIRTEAKKVLPDGAEQTDVMALTPEAVKIAAAAKAFPTAENTTALMSHLAAHSGFEMLTVTEGKPNLIAAAAPAAPSAATAVALEAGWSEEAKAYVAGRLATGMSKDAAYVEFCSRLLP